MGWRIDLLATAAPQDSTSGVSRGIWELGAALVARGHAVRVLFPSSNLQARPDVKGVTAIPVPDPGPGRSPTARDLAIGRNASDLLDPGVDVIVGNDEKAGALEWVRRAGGRPVFAMMVHDVALHTFDAMRPPEARAGLRAKLSTWSARRALRRLELSAISRARVIFVPTELNHELLRRHYGVSGPRVHLLPNGVADPIDAGSREEARLALKVPADVPLVSFIGRTPERQGLATALSAFQRVRVFFPGARFVVVGSTAPSEPGVLSLGVVDELTKARVLRASDVFLFPARYEGFGLAPREAMRYGVATVVSRHVPLEGVDPKRSVRVVPSDDPAEYASELAELLADPRLRRSVGEAGQAYADRFSYARMADQFERFLAPLLP
ncbi:MAG TPA: glycosyltransferase family 4 protein [Thermoplasmata archaeon]|nr:glycosyltransferase family 4 protein [Thermoplasmata archaeon]